MQIGPQVQAVAYATGTGVRTINATNLVPPPNASYASILVRVNNNTGTSQAADFYLDSVMMVTAKDIPPVFISGSTPQVNTLWDMRMAGTSEEIYGVRYGVYRDNTITTKYQAQESGQDIVELSAWPAETYEVSLVDVDDVPANLETGDLVLIHTSGKDLLRRVVEISYNMDQPRALNLVLGEDRNELDKQIERVQRDVEVAISALNGGGP